MNIRGGSQNSVVLAYMGSKTLQCVCYDSLNLELELEHIVETRTAPEEPGMAQMSPNAI